MKNFLLVITLLISTSLKLSAQWSTDPNNNLIVGYGLDPHICSDSAGGCYITYDYHSTAYPRWLALERLDKYGYKSWGINKRILGESPEQSGAEIIEDGVGGVIVSFIDRYENLPYWTQRVRLQKVDSNGNFLWGPTGVKVTLDEINQGSQKIVNDGEGGAVVIWVNTQAQYKVNRISSDGHRMWGDSGIVAGINGWYDPALLARTTDKKYVVSAERNTIKYFDENGNLFYNDSLDFWLFSIISDGVGGIVLSGKVWNGMIPKLVAQRKDSLGSNLWQGSYVEIADSLDIGASLNVLANINYYHYGWLGRKNGVTEILQIQSLRNDGTKLFNVGSISLSDSATSITSIPIISSLEGSNIYAWIYWDSPQTYNANYARRIDTTGSDIWKKSPVLLNEPSLGYFSMTTDCFGGAIGVGYLNSDFAIRVLKVSINGNLGEIITSTANNTDDILIGDSFLYQNHPNPFNYSTIIKYQIDDNCSIKISIYDILGREVKTLVNEQQHPGSYTIKWDALNVSSGVYFYQLKTKDYINTKKMILLK